MPRKGRIGQRNGKTKDRSKDADQKSQHPEGPAGWEKERLLRPEKKDGRPDPAAADGGDLEASGEKAVPGNGRKKEAFPIIGIGASAGGLQALETFFSNVPKESGMAYVVISHSDPDRASLLPDILERKSKIPVKRIGAGMPAEPDTFYLPPSDKDLVIKDRVFHLTERQKKDGLHTPIDTFLGSLAEDCRERAGCIILSGTGTDGTQGLRAIKANAGITVAQSTDSARYPGMPRSAIETDLVDFILVPEKMPEELIRYFKSPGAHEKSTEKEAPESLQKILAFLADRVNLDFSLYKKSTLIRRIERRLNLTRSRNGSEYLNYLYRNPKEVETLFQDMLIGVTGFFRDPEAFAFLKKNILPDLIDREQDSLRIWNPGCSTGEETYSLAIALQEVLLEKNKSRRFQIFATDLDKQAVEKARQGIYIESIAGDVNTERMERFFTRTDHLYQVNKDLREKIVFAPQNVLSDPPFSKLDLLVCRNLLIYLEPEAQRKLIPLFHYSLKTGGVLFLGTSESVGRFGDLFQTVNKKFSIYRKQEGRGDQPLAVEFPFRGGRLNETRQERAAAKPAASEAGFGISQATERVLLSGFTPTCVIIDPDGHILHIHGRTGKYLEPAPGKPSLNIVEMAREGIRFALALSLREANLTGKEVRRERLRVYSNGGFQELHLTVKPLKEPVALKDTLMVVFENIESLPEKAPEHPEEGEGKDPRREHILELERELARVRQDFQGSLEELQASNEELKSTNEELHSSNEELQSTNEELESSREELQSLNEELSTVNSELHSNIEELSETYGAIAKVLNSTRIAILFLDNDLGVRRFTEEAARLVNLIDSDVGRPIDHISHNLKYEHFSEKVREVLKSLSAFEDDVQTKDGHWYRMRIMIFQTREKSIEGVVTTFVNIDAQKQAQAQIEKMNVEALQAERRFSESIVDTVRESLLVLDDNLRVITANRRFYETFALSAAKIEGQPFLEIGEGQWNIGKLRKLLGEIITKGRSFDDYLIEHRFKALGLKRMLLNARELCAGEKEAARILLAIEDITAQKKFGGKSRKG